MKHAQFDKEWFRNKITFTDTQCFLGQTPLQIDNGTYGFLTYGWMRKDNVGTVCFTIPDKKSIQKIIDNLEKLKETASYEEESDMELCKNQC
jgi:hypothetical protein